MQHAAELRGHLHHNIPLSSSLRQQVDRDTDDQLLAMAMAASLSEGTTGRGGEVIGAQGVVPEYDEEDELLAKALQESLNDLI